jgi:hypothetical protein
MLIQVIMIKFHPFSQLISDFEGNEFDCLASGDPSRTAVPPLTDIGESSQAVEK